MSDVAVALPLSATGANTDSWVRGFEMRGPSCVFPRGWQGMEHAGTRILTHALDLGLHCSPLCCIFPPDW